ncbi:MAG: hypothetical protein ACPL3C_09735, partial [Pyrobaculum sp.]
DQVYTLQPVVDVKISKGYVESYNATVKWDIYNGTSVPIVKFTTWRGNGPFKVEFRTTMDFGSNLIVPTYKDVRVYYGTGRKREPEFWIIYAFPAMPIYANASSQGPPYLDIDGKTAYGEALLRGVGALSPIRVYGVEVRSDGSRWLITVGVPGYDPVDNRSILSVLASPGDEIRVEASTGRVKITTPSGVYENKTPYWSPYVGDNPAVAFLSPDGSLWIAAKPETYSVVVKTNAKLKCSSYAVRLDPEHYELYEGAYCEAPNGAAVYYEYDPGAMGGCAVFLTVTYPYGPVYVRWLDEEYMDELNLDYVTLEPVVYRLCTAGANAVSPTKTVVLRLGKRSAAAYLVEEKFDPLTLTRRTELRLVANASQFTVPLFYEVSPKGLRPYIVAVSVYQKSAGNCEYVGYLSYRSRFSAWLFYGGLKTNVGGIWVYAPASYYAQATEVFKPDSSCTPGGGGGGAGGGGGNFTVSNVCFSTRSEELVAHEQRNYEPLPGGGIYTEVWGYYKVRETDCKGNTKEYIEERLMYIVKGKRGPYSVYDGKKVCGPNGAKKRDDGKVVCT